MVGITSGFIAGPCTAPVLGVLLAFAATTGNLLYGGLLLFVFAFGMGAILIAVGTFSGIVAALPKSGVWMVRLKNIMGAGMIVMAEYFFIKAGQLLF